MTAAKDQQARPLTADIDAVRAKFRAMVEEGRVEEMIDAATTLVATMKDENSALRDRLHVALRRIFGRRSERVSALQLQLMLALAGDAVDAADASEANTEGDAGTDEARADEALVPPAPPPPPPHRGLVKSGKKPGRKPIPASLEREVRERKVPDEQRPCPTCGEPRTSCGHEVSEMFGFVPAKVVVIEERREKLVCRACETFATAPVGDRMLDGGRPSAGLLSFILMSKYGDGLPLQRLSEVFSRMGVTFSTSTLSDWVAAATTILEPIALRIAQRVLASFVINVDDTPLPVLDRDDPRGIKKGRLWAYVGDRSLVAYSYTPTWEADGPCGFLEGFQGYLQGDGYRGYARLSDCTLLGCHMHARRKFEAAMDAGDARAAIAMQLYRKVYDLERRYKDDGLSAEERRIQRLEHTRPLFDELKAWIDGVHPTLPPASLLAKATTYAIHQWEALMGFFQDGRLEIDNGEAERRLRRVCMGRSAYLFAGSDAGAERGAIAYTVIVSARMHGLDPWVYLVDVMTQLQRGWPVARIDELLPDRWTNEAAEERKAQQAPSYVAA